MIIIAAVLYGLSRLEGNLFTLSEELSSHKAFFNSVVYFGLININVVLILLLSFLIFRNVVKLVVERRRGVLGSRLRTRLVAALVFFAVAPTALLFYVSTRFLTESFGTWFSSRVESTMLKTREAGALVYKRDKRRIESLARIALDLIAVEDSDQFFGQGLPRMDPSRLEGFHEEYRIDSLKIFKTDGLLVWSSGGLSAEAQASESGSEFVKVAINRFLDNPGMTSRGGVEVEEGRDVVKGIAPIRDQKTGNLIGVVLAEERFETQIIRSVEAIIKEFSNLRPGAQLIKVSYDVLLVVMVLIIVFSATWMGFYVAKGIIGPIQSLAEATREVATGNYEVKLPAPGDDETGQLVRSFSRMIGDLKTNQAKVREFTRELEKSNVELEGRRKYMEVVLRNISAGVIAVGKNGRITSMNDAAERLLGVQAKSAEGLPVREGLGHELWQAFWQPIAERMSDRESFNGQIDLEESGRQLTLLADGIQIFDEMDENLGYVVVFDDASEQVKAQRVAAWREVARRIAHEIKNPITPIKLSAQRLLRRFGKEFGGNDRKVFETCIETIISEVNSLRDLVNEFSKFSRLPTVKTSPGDLNLLLEEVKGLYSMSYPKIEFDSSSLVPDLPMVALDKEQMGRVFNNLVANAIAAISETGEAGRIAFKTTVLNNYNTVRIEISDNGSGIPPGIKNKVLEPYFSTKKEGTGLGLAIVSQIVTDHGGYLRLEDNEPRGTIVVIELPLGESRRRSEEMV